VPVSVLGLLHPLLGPDSNFLVGLVSQLMSRGWLMTACSCMGHGKMCSCLGLIILVVRGLKTGLISYCTIYFCSVG